MERSLATIDIISDIQPIEGADAIEVAQVRGWKVVVKKGEFKVGDKVIYFEIDSWIPHELAPFLINGKEPREYQGVKGERLRTIKLRGQVSQGLVLPISILDHIDYSVGPDVTEVLGIRKWEKEIPANLRGKVKGNFPSFIPKTDAERIQNMKDIPNDIMYVGTEKLHGSSITIYTQNGEVGVCSRNLELKEEDGNAYWIGARNSGIIEMLKSLAPFNYAVQGELVGPGINGNQYELDTYRVYVFNIFDIDTQEYLDALHVVDLCVDYGVLHVPFIEMKYGMKDNILEIVDGMPSIVKPDTLAEGVVYKSRDNGINFKVISNKWLLKNGD